MRVLFICINYGTDTETLRLLRSLAALQVADDQVHVLVVDNTPRSAPWILPHVGGLDARVLSLPQNLGYFGGAAAGLDQAAAVWPPPDFVVVSNVDLVIPQVDFLARLAKTDLAGVGVVAPSIRSRLTGADQNPYMPERPSRRRIWSYARLNAVYPAAAAYERLARVWKVLRARVRRRRERNTCEPRDIYAPHGSFMAFRREFFERGGTLRFGAFLFNEEIFVAEQARALSLRVRYDPELEVEHDEHVSIGRFRSRSMVRFEQQSAELCARTYFTR